ncbi:MAG: DNA methylase [Nitrososphaerota archaeon]|jgi:DNA modification methylase|nr:DNA methylase [Nitrososphaerota archaeon]
MRKITQEEYREFLRSHTHVTVEDQRVDLVRRWETTTYAPADFHPEAWTVWSFEDRGDWATHKGNYRGNWSPFIPRNLIEHYTKKGDTVCDPMLGSGTTLVECKLLGRKGIGVDVNGDAVMVAMNRLDFELNTLDHDYSDAEINVYQGDARYLDAIEDGKVDLVATHPPYWGIIPYSKAAPGDLSGLGFDGFMESIGKVAKECYRILKPDGHCGILIGDTRRHKHYVPISVGVLGRFLDAGFILREDVIKLQHNTKMSRERWNGNGYDFYKIAHEHLYVFRKPLVNEGLSDYKHSLKWW